LTKPFRLSSKFFLARILESDKAENLVSFPGSVEITGFLICDFSTTASAGFAVSIFSVVVDTF
jgi:hypothetical protein